MSKFFVGRKKLINIMKCILWIENTFSYIICKESGPLLMVCNVVDVIVLCLCFIENIANCQSMSSVNEMYCTLY